MKRLPPILLLTLLLSFACARADTLTLPAFLYEIGEEAFLNNASITDVVVPEGVESIGSRAFAGTAIDSLTLPDSVTEIAPDAFEGATVGKVNAPTGSFAQRWAYDEGLIASTPAEDFEYTITDGECTITKYKKNEENVVIPSEIEGCPVTMIGKSAFSNKAGVQSVILPDSVTRINQNAFTACNRLENISFPKNLQTIGDYAFSSCGSLKTVVLPDTVSSIGTRAFVDCTNLEEAKLSASLKALPEKVFWRCEALTFIEIPPACVSIGARAFSECSSLSSVSFPPACASIGEMAFENCSRSLVPMEKKSTCSASRSLRVTAAGVSISTPKGISSLNGLSS